MLTTLGKVKVTMGPIPGSNLSEGVPIRLKDGTYRNVRWLGFVEEGASELQDGHKVKIKVEAICHDKGPIPENWAPGGYIPDVVVDRGVYGVRCNK